MKWLAPVLYGFGAGALVGLGAYFLIRRSMNAAFEAGSVQLAAQVGIGEAELARRLAEGRAMLEQQIATEVRNRVPPLVDSQIRTTLASYGLTPERGRLISQLIGSGTVHA